MNIQEFEDQYAKLLEERQKINQQALNVLEVQIKRNLPYFNTMKKHQLSFCNQHNEVSAYGQILGAEGDFYFVWCGENHLEFENRQTRQLTGQVIGFGEFIDKYELEYALDSMVYMRRYLADLLRDITKENALRVKVMNGPDFKTK